MRKSTIICKNCSFENESSFQYCPSCGQKNTDGKITFRELWSEFQDAIFNIESRTWRTLKNLFIPGRLTQEYFLGKHRRYVHPLRLLLVSSVLFILAISFQDFQSFTNHGYDVNKRILRNHERQRLYRILTSISDTTKAAFQEDEIESFNDTILTAFGDSLERLLITDDNIFAYRYGDEYGDSIDLNTYVSFDPESSERISKGDFLNLDEDELVEKYKKDSKRFERLIFKQKVKYIKDESQLSAAIIGLTTWAFLLMMPCLGLILHLLYFRRKYFYVEHLIFTFHLQSFAFLVLAFLIVGMNVFPWWVFLTFTLVILIYLFTSIWKVYKQSIAKTSLKFVLFTISYIGVFIAILLGTLLISFLLL